MLLRRTRLGLLAARELCAPGAEVPERVARALAAELGWDDARVAEEAERFRAAAAAEGILPASPPQARANRSELRKDAS